MSTPLDLVTVPQPHFIPGYTGYCPQYIFRAGNTYGSCTHKLLVDPTITHSENLVLSDRTADDYQVYRPSQGDIDIVKSRFRHGNTIYQHPMVPGYEGFVPRIHNQFGQCYSVEATEGLSEFEKHQHKNRNSLHHVKIVGAAQDDRFDPKSLQDKTLIKASYKLPLVSVRPEQVAVIRDRKVVEPALEPPIQSQSPYFMNLDNPNKYIIKGSGIHVPFGYSRFGATNDPMTNSALCDFTSNYRKKFSTEWAPVNLSRPDPPLHFQPMEIYHKHVGMLPNYGGHIPGAIFRCGKTIGEDSRDAKRWLRRDFRPPDFQILVYQQTKMTDRIIQETFRRIQASKSRFPGHVDYGYIHGAGEKFPKINVNTNEFMMVCRQKRGTEWVPKYLAEHPKPVGITCYAIHHCHVGQIPNYAGHIPGGRFRYGRTFGADTIDVKRWFRGDHRPN